MQALAKMSSNWNDDDRDTRVSFNTYRPFHKVEETQSVCAAVRDFYRDQKESLYTWTVEKYNAELTKRFEQALPPPPLVYDDDIVTNIPHTDEKQVPEEFNNEIMDKEIYKKSWYS